MKDQTGTILIVDDDWMIREILQAHLQAAGYTVLMAHSGEKALEIAAQTPPDLVILDLRLQGLSGYDVCAGLRQQEATRAIPVLVMTAMDDYDTRLRAVEVGADDFLPKPFEAIVLLTRTRSLIRIKRLQDEQARRERLLPELLSRHLPPAAVAALLAELEHSG